MTELITPAASLAAPAVVDGVDLDAVGVAVRGCVAVDDLCAGLWGGVVSYLPGRQVAGVRVASDHVVISVRGRWGVPVNELASQVRAAVRPLAAPRRVDIVVADLTEPAAATPDRGGLPAACAPGVEVSSWTTTSPCAGGPGASSSVPITPTTAAIPSRS
ncbi:MAG TPA: hypothetical protein VGI74_15780 [Streptosporangiaceae bacterium]